MDSLTFVRRRLGPLAGKRLLDVGCGGGVQAKALLEDGARVAGVDPDAAKIAAARALAPGGEFRVAGGEALPFEDASFEAALFFNSLHHVPVEAMATALREARRVTAAGGRVVVIEPLVETSFNAVLKLINDEAVVRAAAQDVLRDGAPGLAPLHSEMFAHRGVYADFPAFLARATAADRSRHAVAAARRAEIEAAFLQHAERVEGGFALDERLKADVFAVA